MFLMFVVTSVLTNPLEFEFKFDGKKWCDEHIDKTTAGPRAVLNFTE